MLDPLVNAGGVTTVDGVIVTTTFLGNADSSRNGCRRYWKTRSGSVLSQADLLSESLGFNISQSQSNEQKHE